MKRVAVVGAVMFLLGAASSPKAANDGETLQLLCARYKATAAQKEQQHMNFIKISEQPGVPADLAKKYRDRDEAVVIALRAVRDMVCK